MCGIAGRINLFSHRPVNAGAIGAMCALLQHRGPDDQGVWVEEFAGLGHRRLSIIDLSPGGHQPMRSASGRYWIAFNGEIYNYQDLRRTLEQLGIRFRSSSDTEVLLEAFEIYGPACLDRLRGMFAFAIWDTRDRQLFMARDRAGKKPLYYRSDADGIAFASEPKAFFAEPTFEPRANLPALAAFLSLQYVPSPQSAFDGVCVLPPAHYLVATDRGVNVHRYWQLAYEPKSALGEEEAEEQLLATMKEAVRLRMISDVPLGAFLSGGVDSSVVVALMCELGGHRGSVKTFSIGFEEQGFNELPYARMVAQRYGTEHHEFVVTARIHDLLPTLVRQYDEPFGDSSAVPTWYLSKLTRDHVTVALNGDGGDENLAGYDRYFVNARNAAYARLPILVRKAIASVLDGLPAVSDNRAAALKRWTQVWGLPEAERAAVSRMIISPGWKAILCTPEFLTAAGDDAAIRHLARAYSGAAATSELDKLLAMDFDTYLPGALLPKVDIATMAFGLEGRSPLLDQEVLEFCARLPVDLKRRGADGKWLLKRIARRLVPAASVDRPKKGFSMPLARWFRKDLKALVFDTLLDETAHTRGLLHQPAVRRFIEQHESGTRDWHEPIWLMLMMELWCRQHLHPSTAAPTASDAVLLPAS